MFSNFLKLLLSSTYLKLNRLIEGRKCELMLTYRDAQEGEGGRQQRVRIEKLDPGVGPSVPRIKQLAGTRGPDD